MSDLVKRLTIKAGVMEMGERIAWGSDTALMREAANHIEQLKAKADRYEKALKEIAEHVEYTSTGTPVTTERHGRV